MLLCKSNLSTQVLFEDETNDSLLGDRIHRTLLLLPSFGLKGCTSSSPTPSPREEEKGS